MFWKAQATSINTIKLKILVVCLSGNLLDFISSVPQISISKCPSQLLCVGYKHLFVSVACTQTATDRWRRLFFYIHHLLFPSHLFIRWMHLCSELHFVVSHVSIYLFQTNPVKSQTCRFFLSFPRLHLFSTFLSFMSVAADTCLCHQRYPDTFWMCL